MLRIASVYQSESGWTVISFAPVMENEVLVLPAKEFCRTADLDAEGIEPVVGMSVRRA